MRVDAYWIDDIPTGRLAIMPRPRAGDWLSDEVIAWTRLGLDTILSLLEDDEIADLGLDQEPEFCRQHGIRFLRFPISDRGVPSSQEKASDLVESLVAALQRGETVGIHCRMGIGRSALIAGSVLVAIGHDSKLAWSIIEKSRGVAVPDTPSQKVWLESFADRCGGG